VVDSECLHVFSCLHVGALHLCRAAVGCIQLLRFVRGSCLHHRLDRLAWQVQQPPAVLCLPSIGTEWDLSVS
jgi:hypothetical protein